MKVMEANRGKWFIFKEYAITIATTVDKLNPLDIEVRHIRNALDAWLKKRAGKCWRIVVQVTADPADFDKITAAIKDMADHNPSLKKLHKRLVLFNPQGVQCQDIDLNLMQSAAADPATAKKELGKK